MLVSAYPSTGSLNRVECTCAYSHLPIGTYTVHYTKSLNHTVVNQHLFATGVP
nr:MAG TPA: hypothetical protein [Caudoviricetes sp.]